MKILLFLMTFASSASIVSTLGVKKQNKKAVEQKITLPEYKIDDSDRVQVIFSYDAKDDSNFESLNSVKISQLNLSRANDIYGSKFGPFIEASYENYSDFVNYDLPKLQDKNLLDYFKYSVSDVEESFKPCGSDWNVDADNKTYVPFATALDQCGLSGSTFTGNGIKVGILECDRPDTKDLAGWGDIDYTILPNKNCATTPQSSLYGGETIASRMYHGYTTASIAATKNGIAKNASLYLASTYGYGGYIKAVDGLVSNGVNIINASMGYSAYLGNYMGCDAYTDYISEVKNVTFVISAGNDGGGSYHYVSSPGNSFNAITVGASYKSNTAFFSSYGAEPIDLGDDDYDNYVFKPDVVAPGQNLYKIPTVDPSRFNSSSVSIDGTSFSAPIVSGVCALLMEEFPFLKTSPETLKAAIIASANPLKEKNYAKEGYGIINYEAAREACKRYGSVYLISGNNTVARTFTVPAGATLSAAVSASVRPDTSLIRTDSCFIPTRYIDVINPTISLKDTNGNLIADNSVDRGNCSVLKYTNTNSYSQTVTINFSSHENSKLIASYASLSYFVDSEIADVELQDTTTYLDANPTFKFRPTDATLKIYSNPYISMRLHDSYGRIIKEYGFTAGAKAAGKYNSITVGKTDWLKAIETTGRDIFISFAIRSSDKSNIKFTKMKRIHEPTDYKNSSSFVPADYKFTKTGYLDTEETFSMSKNGLNVQVKGLRCGHIEQQYINLSPRHTNAGVAYLELTFDKAVYSYLIGVCFWNEKSRNDYLERNYHTGKYDFKCIVETMDKNGHWSEDFDLINDCNISTNRNQIDRFETYHTEGIYGVRFYATGNDTGVYNISKNFARLCIDDVVLNTNSAKTYSAIWTTFYSPITVKDKFVNVD